MPADDARIRPRRAVLVVPASSERMLAKAASVAVDELVLDLEDAVAARDKPLARERAGAWLRDGRHAATTIAVRINGLGTPAFADDLAALAAWPVPPDSVVVPKAEPHAAFDRLPAGIGVQLLIESAQGLLAAEQLCGAGASVCAVVLGYADLCASLGRPASEIADPTAWTGAQDHLVACARAAGIQAIDGPILALDDHGLPGRAAAWARRRGFDGKWVIHPAHVDAVAAAFTPTAEEVAAAEALLAELAAAEAAGAGTARHQGMMIDEALRRSAQQTLARVGRAT